MNICEWYNSDTLNIQNYISNPYDFIILIRLINIKIFYHLLKNLIIILN